MYYLLNLLTSLIKAIQVAVTQQTTVQLPKELIPRRRQAAAVHLHHRAVVLQEEEFQEKIKEILS